MEELNRQILNEISKRLAKKLRRYTPQLYLINQSFPIPRASSVLIQVKEKYFIVTAGHVIEGTSWSDIKICVNDEYLVLRGNWYYPNMESLDLAAMPLGSDSVKIISEHFDFYRIDYINPDHRISLEQHFFVFGFPCSKTKTIKRLQKIKVKAHITYTNLQDKVICNELGIHPNVHLLLNLNRKALKSSETGEAITPPEQFGMSGCGIWHIPVENPNLDDIPVVLSGIYIEYLQPHNSIVATRTLILTEFLRIHFKAELQPSKLVHFDN